MPCEINPAIYVFMTQGPYLVIGGLCYLLLLDPGPILGRRQHLLKDDNEYKLFRMLEKQISFDDDMTNNFLLRQ